VVCKKTNKIRKMDVFVIFCKENQQNEGLKVKFDVFTSSLCSLWCSAGRGGFGSSRCRHSGFRMVGYILRQQRGQGFVVAFAAGDESRTLVCARRLRRDCASRARCRTVRRARHINGCRAPAPFARLPWSRPGRFAPPCDERSPPDRPVGSPGN